jgi:Na+-driven multidrug efflux pump
MGIVNSIATMIVMAIVAINMASQPIISYNYGAKSYARVKETLKISIIAASAIALLAFIMVESFPSAIVKLFNSRDEGLLVIGKQGLQLALLALPLVGFQVVAGNFFQSVGNSKVAVLLTLLRQVIILMPLLFVLPGLFGLRGIWISMPIADTCSAMIVLFFLTHHIKKLSKEIN